MTEEEKNAALQLWMGEGVIQGMHQISFDEYEFDEYEFDDSDVSICTQRVFFSGCNKMAYDLGISNRMFM